MGYNCHCEISVDVPLHTSVIVDKFWKLDLWVKNFHPLLYTDLSLLLRREETQGPCVAGRAEPSAHSLASLGKMRDAGGNNS